MRGLASTWLRIRLALALSMMETFVQPDIAFAAQANADEDGVYGRLDGDITLSPDIGMEHYRSRIAPTLGFDVRYLSTLGVTLTHADTRLLFGAESSDRSVTAVDFKVYPLFLSRWSQAWEVGPPLLDLTLDSFTIGVGAFWDYDHKIGILRRGTSVSTGLAFPLLVRVKGPWLNAALGLRFAEGPAFSAPTDSFASVSVSWNWLVDSAIHSDD